MRKHKYGAKKTVSDGIRFDSMAEAEFYRQLTLLQKEGEVLRFEVQPKIYLTAAKILYKPDFKVWGPDSVYYVDIKGMETPVFRIKARLWRHYGDGVLRTYKKSGKGFKMTNEYISCAPGSKPSP
jgi:predicted nuclease of restriction endonuclease-like RecB superfamily